MLDQVVPPVFLDHGHSDSVRHSYEAAVEVARTAVNNLDPEAREQVRGRMHWFLQNKDIGEALVVLATTPAYFTIPNMLFDADAHPDSRVFSTLPKLAEALDDDGLLDCTGLEVTDQTLFYGDWSLQYHQLLRRHFNSHINDSLIGVLLDCGSSAGNSLRLAVDERRLRRRDEFLPYGEKDFWYGPHLSQDLIDVANRGGRTVHADPAGDDSTDGYTKFVAIWYEDGPNRKVVQMEEMITASSIETLASSHRQNCSFRLLRYLHAIRDTDSHEFVHCDGAVRAYDDEAYAKRVTHDWSAEGRATKYRKVFRIDGRIPTDTWSDIVARWFRHNQLANRILKHAHPTVGWAARNICGRLKISPICRSGRLSSPKAAEVAFVRPAETIR
jgi:hypothetical protein